MPPKTRAFLISAAAEEKFENDRVTPIMPYELTVNAVFSPKRLASTTVAALLTVEWALGYSGCGGVAMRGVQDGSTSVAGFPSVSASRIDVIGRQKEYLYLALKFAIKASAVARLRIDIKRAFYRSIRRRSAKSESATCSQRYVAVALAQNCA